MSWTKSQLIAQAYIELGLPDYIFDLDPEDINTAVIRLDGMIAGWQLDGIRFGYPLAASPADADPDLDSNIPIDCCMGVAQNLAIVLAPTIGKSVSADTMKSASNFYAKILNKFQRPIPKQFGKDLPRGAGNKPWRGGLNTEYFQESDDISLDNDGILST